MILKCLIDGTMTAFLNGKTKIDGKMPSHQYNHKININPQYKANRIRPELPQGRFVLYCSKQGKIIYFADQPRKTADC